MNSNNQSLLGLLIIIGNSRYCNMLNIDQCIDSTSAYEAGRHSVCHEDGKHLNHRFYPPGKCNSVVREKRGQGEDSSYGAPEWVVHAWRRHWMLPAFEGGVTGGQGLQDPWDVNRN